MTTDQVSSVLPTPTTFMTCWTELSSSSQPAARCEGGLGGGDDGGGLGGGGQSRVDINIYFLTD